MNLEDEHSAPEADNKSSTESVSPRKPAGFFQERSPQVMEVDALLGVLVSLFDACSGSTNLVTMLP